ncbi:MAG: thioredoxin domain-containing protein [Acidobacteriota bacterium]
MLEKIPTALPGGEPLSDDLRRRLAARLASLGPDYEPRTRHRRPDGSPLYTNRLFLESSPYLQQHAHNPVNWYPWGDEAFDAARRLGRPVLLSIGYSTCHWCHVMEEESFEDDEIARVINELYVPIKVDREVRPDVDAVYMQAVQAMQGRGGWPLNTWLTPDREPFFGGTYFPARDGDRGARTGFLTILQRLSQIYLEKPDQVAQQARQVAEAVKRGLESGGSVSHPLPGPEVLRQAASFYAGRFDGVHGGVSGAPKFPSSLPVRVLLRHARRTGDAPTLHMAALTLSKMAAGGMYDQIGGGFHRYSTDDHWLVPHFEKMLYDNALLAIAYLEGWQATGDASFAGITRDILRYVGREMTSPEGGFYSATDADSPTPSGKREEGWFFTWTPAEIEAAVGKQRAAIADALWGVTARGNFEGRTILSVVAGTGELAKKFGKTEEEMRAVIADIRAALYESRRKRPAPLRDDKILVAWNGLMISAYARAGLALHSTADTETAARAARFILDRMRTDDGHLHRVFQNGQSAQPAFLEDYAFLIAGLLDLYEADADPRWIEEATRLQALLDTEYADPSGGYFTTAAGQEKLLAREKPAYDGAEPSGNSVAVLSLLRLAEFTTDDAYRASADAALAAFAPNLARAPASLSEMLLALDFRLDRAVEVVIIRPASGDDGAALLDPLRRTFLPNRVVAVVREGDQQERNSRAVPLLAGKVAIDGQTTAYVCEKGVCQLPTRDPQVFIKQIGRVVPLDAEGS